MASALELPGTMREVAAAMEAAVGGLASEPIRLQAWSADDVASLRTAVLPDRLTAEVEEFLRTDLVSPWAELRMPLDQCLQTLDVFRTGLGAPHWLPIGAQERDNWSVVLGAEELERSPVAVWSSAALTTSAPFPSLRTHLLGYAEAAWAGRHRYADLQRELAFSDWWLASTDVEPLAEHRGLWNVLERPLGDLISAEGASPLWPAGLSPMPPADDVDRAWDPRWIRALRVEER
ncbi:MAG: hypothetical protein KF703_13265 [Actinobacteria bacterium]|nr:hypothetical protein [Actinomycetota bacterium]